MDSESAKHTVFTMNFIDFAKSVDFFFFFLETFSSWAREAENPKNLRDLGDLGGWRSGRLEAGDLGGWDKQT